jgi:hypothetical protein
LAICCASAQQNPDLAALQNGIRNGGAEDKKRAIVEQRNEAGEQRDRAPRNGQAPRPSSVLEKTRQRRQGQRELETVDNASDAECRCSRTASELRAPLRQPAADVKNR